MSDVLGLLSMFKICVCIMGFTELERSKPLKMQRMAHQSCFLYTEVTQAKSPTSHGTSQKTSWLQVWQRITFCRFGKWLRISIMMRMRHQLMKLLSGPNLSQWNICFCRHKHSTKGHRCLICYLEYVGKCDLGNLTDNRLTFSNIHVFSSYCSQVAGATSILPQVPTSNSSLSFSKRQVSSWTRRNEFPQIARALMQNLLWCTGFQTCKRLKKQTLL